MLDRNVIEKKIGFINFQIGAVQRKVMTGEYTGKQADAKRFELERERNMYQQTLRGCS